MTTTLQKEPGLLELLAKLWEDFEPDTLELVDHWVADLCAIGIVRKGAPRQLAYVSILHEAPSRFYLELESPGETEDPADYRVAGQWDNLSYEELRPKLAEHLGLEPNRSPSTQDRSD